MALLRPLYECPHCHCTGHCHLVSCPALTAWALTPPPDPLAPARGVVLAVVASVVMVGLLAWALVVWPWS